MLKETGKIVGILILLELVLFLAMIITGMTDEKPPAIGEVFYWALKYIFGFPLVLLNEDYPFFLDRKNMPGIAIILIITNNIIISLIIMALKKRFS